MSSYTQGEVLAITYDLWISGTKIELDKKVCITSIEIKETVEGSDVATIQISDPEFRYIEDNIFIEENTIKISLGWEGTTYRVNFNGYISAIDIDFNSEGCPNVTVTCMDNTHKMNTKKKSNTYKNTTSASVVKKIVKSYGFTCVVDENYSFTKQETITQSDQTDIEFITRLASDEVHPFTARLVDNTFYYVKMGKLTTPAMTLSYKKYPHEVISFNPKINKETKKVEVTSSTVNTSSKSVSTTTGTKTTSSGSATKNGSTSTSNNNNNTTTTSSSTSTNHTYNPSTKTWS